MWVFYCKKYWKKKGTLWLHQMGFNFYSYDNEHSEQPIAIIPKPSGHLIRDYEYFNHICVDKILNFLKHLFNLWMNAG